MASGPDNPDPGQPDSGSRECMPCAGRGVVISRLGGEEHDVSCPWCGGTGERQEGVDAQARWIAERGEEDLVETPASEGEPE